MEIAFKEIEELATNILPEFMETFHKIRAENPKWSKIKIFKALFKIGEKKHSSLNEVQDAEFLELFTGFLSKKYTYPAKQMNIKPNIAILFRFIRVLF